MKISDIFKRQKTERSAKNAGAFFKPIFSDYSNYISDERLRKCSAITAPIDFIGGLLGSLTLQVWENQPDGDRRIKNGLSARLDIEPAPNTTRMEWVKRVVALMYLDGVCYVAPIVGEDNYLKELKILNNCQLIKRTDGGYNVASDGKTYKGESLIQFKLSGVSILEQLKPVLKNLVTAQELKERFYKEAFNPNSVIYLDVDMTAFEQDDERYKALLASINSAAQNNAPIFLEKDFAEYHELKGRTFGDLGIDKALSDELKQIASVFGLPAFFLGVGQFNKEEYNLFILTTFQTLVRTFEQALSRVLVSSSYYVKYDVKKLLNIDLKTQVDMISKMVALGIMTPNEARGLLGYAPSTMDGMNEFRILENYIPADLIGEQNKLKGGSDKDGEA